MFQIDNLRAGDIVVFVDDVTGSDRDIMGMVIDVNPDPHDEQAALIQFYGKHDLLPLHYYYHELDNFLEIGEIRIQSAS